MKVKCTALGLGVALMSLMAIQPAFAGSGGFKHSSGKSVYIKCTGGGCAVTHYDKAGKATKVDRSAGGSDNYAKLVSSYKSKGYK